MIAEIIGPDGRIHYRRPATDPAVDEARRTPGYSVRMVDSETIEPPRWEIGKNGWDASDDATREDI